MVTKWFEIAVFFLFFSEWKLYMANFFLNVSFSSRNEDCYEDLLTLRPFYHAPEQLLIPLNKLPYLVSNKLNKLVFLEQCRVTNFHILWW